jgi:hypothetical protein
MLAKETSTTMSYYKEGSVPSIYAPTNSNLEGDLSLASTKSELLILLVDARNLNVLFKCEFSCIVQLILYNYRAFIFKCYLFR